MRPTVLPWLVLLMGLLVFPLRATAVGPQVSPTNCELTWVAPTHPDGTPVDALDSYRIYLSRTSGDYDYTKPLASPPKDRTNAFCATVGALPLGQWYLVMRSADAAGHVSVNSAEVPFEVVVQPTADVAAPEVEISHPNKGDVVPRKASVPIDVVASDDSGLVMEVVVFVNRVSICRLTHPPYRCLWEVPAASKRTYTLQASAGDFAGNRGLSLSIQVRSE
jgi:hypothetical protein